jgi:hypothetical protein
LSVLTSASGSGLHPRAGPQGNVKSDSLRVHILVALYASAPVQHYHYIAIRQQKKRYSSMTHSSYDPSPGSCPKGAFKLPRVTVSGLSAHERHLRSQSFALGGRPSAVTVTSHPATLRLPRSPPWPLRLPLAFSRRHRDGHGGTRRAVTPVAGTAGPGPPCSRSSKSRVQQTAPTHSAGY